MIVADTNLVIYLYVETAKTPQARRAFQKDPAWAAPYTPAAQDIIAKSYYRPIDPATAAKYKSQFKDLKLYTIDKDFGKKS